MPQLQTTQNKRTPNWWQTQTTSSYYPYRKCKVCERWMQWKPLYQPNINILKAIMNQFVSHFPVQKLAICFSRGADSTGSCLLSKGKQDIEASVSKSFQERSSWSEGEEVPCHPKIKLNILDKVQSGAKVFGKVLRLMFINFSYPWPFPPSIPTVEGEEKS